MLWFYSRDGDTLRLETLYDNNARMYQVILRWPDGREETERFVDQVSFRRRLEALEVELVAERWTQKGLPGLLPDGWPREPPGR